MNGVDVSGLRIGSIDNPNLKPERSSELEGGFESSFFGGRASLEVTRYYKRTRDALMRSGAYSLPESCTRYMPRFECRQPGRLASSV